MRPRILLVDDDPNAREALCELLADEGYDVDIAVDGESACARLRSFHPDLVLTDLMMPRLDGLGLLALLREMLDPPAVVLMSARSDTTADAPLVRKPIAIEDLLHTLACTLAARSARDA